MYLTRDFGTDLRQGDIFTGMAFPVLNLAADVRVAATSRWADRFQEGSLQFHRPKESKGRQINSNVLAEMELDATNPFYIVLSQCCDLAARENRLPSNFIVSPLAELELSQLTEKQRELIRLNVTKHRLGNFYLQALPPVLAAEMFVDFSRCISLNRAQYRLVADQRVAQLDDYARMDLKRKLSLFLGRPCEEEREIWQTGMHRSDARLKEYEQRQEAEG